MKNLERIKLVKIVQIGRVKRILLASYLKEDFIDRAVTLYVRDDTYLDQLYFSSNKYGTAEWRNGEGIVDCHQWEDEETVQSYSTLSKHYTALLLDGKVPLDYCMDNIIPDILNNMPNQNFAEYISHIVSCKEFTESLDLMQFSIDITKNVIIETE